MRSASSSDTNGRIYRVVRVCDREGRRCVKAGVGARPRGTGWKEGGLLATPGKVERGGGVERAGVLNARKAEEGASLDG